MSALIVIITLSAMIKCYTECFINELEYCSCKLKIN